MRLAVLCLLLSACTTNAYHGLATVQIHTNTLNTQQPCITEPEILAIADTAVALYLKESADAGLVAYPHGAKRLREVRPFVCIVEKKESCGMATGLKSGCASWGWAWVARECPSWKATLVHEVGHVVAMLWGIPQDAAHTNQKWNGVESAVHMWFQGRGVY
jgi:hypothetical protein